MEIVFVSVTLLSFICWCVWLTKMYWRLEKEMFVYQVDLNRSIYVLEQQNELIVNELESLSFPKTIKLHWAKKTEK